MMAGNKAILDKFVPPFCGDKVNYACLSMTDSTGGADSREPAFDRQVHNNACQTGW